MALVICCVFLTERMRRRISIRLGIGFCRWVLRQEARLELFDDRLYLGASDPSSSAFLVRISSSTGAVRVVHEAVQLGFELAADARPGDRPGSPWCRRR